MKIEFSRAIQLAISCLYHYRLMILNPPDDRRAHFYEYLKSTNGLEKYAGKPHIQVEGAAAERTVYFYFKDYQVASVYLVLRVDRSWAPYEIVWSNNGTEQKHTLDDAERALFLDPTPTAK